MAEFYKHNNFALSVYHDNTLKLKMKARLNTVGIQYGTHDSGYIELPLDRLAIFSLPMLRFYVVHADKDFGVWVYSFDESSDYCLNHCCFSVIKGSNTFDVPSTVQNNSLVGFHISPCYEIVNDDILEILIYFPEMNFVTAPLNEVREYANDKQQSQIIDSSKIAKELTEVRIDHELLTAYQNIMKEENYDIYFVVDGKKIGTFKFSLCAVSDVFKAALKDHTKEYQTGEIAITDFEYETVKTFIDALHNYKICFDNDPIKTLKIKMIANKYNVAAIEKAALNAFNIKDVNKDNFVAIYRLAVCDDQIIDLLTKRFVQMKVDIKELTDFEQLDSSMEMQLFRSAYTKLIGK